MSYEHKQRGYFHWLLFAVAASMFTFAWTVHGPGRIGLSSFGGLMALLGFSFVTLTVCDDGDALSIAFGPVPLMRRRVPYADVRSARVGRSTLIDGWGVHWLPKRGWIWNLWGFECVELTLADRLLRIGTDDPQGLAEFLRSRIRPESA